MSKCKTSTVPEIEDDEQRMLKRGRPSCLPSLPFSDIISVLSNNFRKYFSDAWKLILEDCNFRQATLVCQ